MLSKEYSEYCYIIDGESLSNEITTFFEPEGVYLIIDKTIKTIWLWAGQKSRLFHRYIASNWAGKLKGKKQYYDYQYELIKQGREPEEFIPIYNEIIEGRVDLKYPGESRTFIVKKEENPQNSIKSSQMQKSLSNSQKTHINKILSEIIEMQNHIKYSLEHISKRIVEIQKIIK